MGHDAARLCTAQRRAMLCRAITQGIQLTKLENWPVFKDEALKILSFLQIYAVGGRNWFEGEAGIEEEIFSSTEVFDTETEKWSAGPDLPKPLAFATAVTAPHATFILGGQTEAGNIYSVSIFKNKSDANSGLDYFSTNKGYQSSVETRC